MWQGRHAAARVPDGVRSSRPPCRAGVSHARNVGRPGGPQRAALALIDDDELVAPSWAAGALQGFEDGADAVFGPVDPMDGEGRPHRALTGDAPRWIEPRERPWNAGTGGNMAATREMLARARRLRPAARPRQLRPVGRGHVPDRAPAARRRQAALAPGDARRPTRRRRTPRCSPPAIPYGFGAGRIVRRLRSAALAARYGADLGWAAREALRRRSPQRARELVATARGFAAGALLPDRWVAPEALLERTARRARRRAARPPSARAAGAASHTTRTSSTPSGEHRLLHVYGEPGPGQARGAARPRARCASSASRAGSRSCTRRSETPTELWLVEERLPGRAAATEAAPAVVGRGHRAARRALAPDGPARARRQLVARGRGRAGRGARAALARSGAGGARRRRRPPERGLPTATCSRRTSSSTATRRGSWTGTARVAEGLPGLDLAVPRGHHPHRPPRRRAAARAGRGPRRPRSAAARRARGRRAGRRDRVRRGARRRAARGRPPRRERASRPLGRDVAPPPDFARLLDDAGPALARRSALAADLRVERLVGLHDRAPGVLGDDVARAPRRRAAPAGRRRRAAAPPRRRTARPARHEQVLARRAPARRAASPPPPSRTPSPPAACS